MSRECERLHEILKRGKCFDFNFERDKLHNRGIYVFYENGEIGHGGNRIVRIGQASVSLGKRLTAHFCGKHGKSIFRKNIGRVILRDNRQKLQEWNNDANATETEDIVSERLKKNFYFKAIVIEDKMRRCELENKMIATVYNCEQCCPSENWLGNYSPEAKIRESGLWQKQGLFGSTLNEDDLSEIEKCLIK